MERRNEIASFLNRAHKNPRPPFVRGRLNCKWHLLQVKEVRSWPNQMQVWLPPKVKTPHLAYLSPSLSSWPHWEKSRERRCTQISYRKRISKMRILKKGTPLPASAILASCLTFSFALGFYFTI